MKTRLKRKDKLREKIYDLVYGDDLNIEHQCHCYDTDQCSTGCFTLKDRSNFYDELIKLLENAGVYLDKEI